MVTISVELGGGQESEGGWRADAEGTDVKGGRKRRGSAEKKARKRMGTIPEQLKITQNHRTSEMERDQRPPKESTSLLKVAERPGLAQGHITRLQVMLEAGLRPRDPQFLTGLTSSTLEWGGKGFFLVISFLKILASNQSVLFFFFF